MDKLFIRQLQVPALIGVFAQERHKSQILMVDLEIAIDAKEIAKTDDLSHAIDYASIRCELLDFAAKTEFLLIETLAVQMADHLLKTFDLSWLKLTITKKPFDITDAQGVGVTVEKNKNT